MHNTQGTLYLRWAKKLSVISRHPTMPVISYGSILWCYGKVRQYLIYLLFVNIRPRFRKILPNPCCDQGHVFLLWYFENSHFEKPSNLIRNPQLKNHKPYFRIRQLRNDYIRLFPIIIQFIYSLLQLTLNSNYYWRIEVQTVDHLLNTRYF